MSHSQYISYLSALRFATIVSVILVTALLPDVALADGSDMSLPYEEGLGKFQESLEGPVPFAISLVGIVACGAMLIFGGEISGFMRTMIFIVLVVAVIVQAHNVVEMLGGKKSLVTDHVSPEASRDRHIG
jgi:type IV secretion system protein VirB2